MLSNFTNRVRSTYLEKWNQLLHPVEESVLATPPYSILARGGLSGLAETRELGSEFAV